MERARFSERIEDHALERVPDQDRHRWLDISWNTAGIVTTLAALFTGALATFIAGLHLRQNQSVSSASICW